MKFRKEAAAYTGFGHARFEPLNRGFVQACDGRMSRPIASARVSAPIAAEASLASSNGLRTDWIWRFVMVQMYATAAAGSC